MTKETEKGMTKETEKGDRTGKLEIRKLAMANLKGTLKKEVVICREFASTPQIVEMVSFGRDRRRNELCIALEYMDCGSLRNKSSFTLPEVKWISVSVLKALRALHSKLMVHNDVKPDNILFDSRGAVKLTDFG